LDSGSEAGAICFAPSFFLYSTRSVAFLIASFWVLVPMNSAIIFQRFIVPGGNLTMPFVSNAISSLDQFSSTSSYFFNSSFSKASFRTLLANSSSV